MNASPDDVLVATFLRDYQRCLQLQGLLRSKQEAFKCLYGADGATVTDGEVEKLVARMVELDQLNEDFALARSKMEHSERLVQRRRTAP